MSAPSVAAWNILGDGSSAITWVCGVLSGVQVLKSTFTYVDKQSVGGLLRRGREQLKMLRDHAAKLTPQERRLIDSKRPGYLPKVERFIIRAGEFLDRVECDHSQGLLRKWQVYGPSYCNEVKKSLIDTEAYTVKLRNDLMSTSSKIRGLTGAIAAHVPEYPLDDEGSFLDMGHASQRELRNQIHDTLPIAHGMVPSAVSLPARCASSRSGDERSSASMNYVSTSTSPVYPAAYHYGYQS